MADRDQGSAWSLLRERDVSLLLAAELLSTLAFGVIAAALGWQAYRRTHDPLVLGLIGLAEFVPNLLLAIPAGHAADRLDRRRVTALGALGGGLAALLLVADAASGDTRAWPLYLLALVGGGARVFNSAAFNPMIAAAVPASSLARAMALSSSTWQAALVGGPLVGGLLQAVGDVPPFAAAAVLEGLTAAFVLRVAATIGTAHVEGEREPATLAAAFGGVRFILATPALLGAIGLDLVAVLFGGATALLPVFATDVLHVGSVGYGVLRAAPGVGAVLIGLGLAARPIRRRVGVVLLVAVGTFGAATVGFGLSRSFPLSLAALGVLAGADMVSVFIRATLGPLLTPPALRGRVGAVERVFIGASNELGAFESGVAASLLSPVAAVVIGGVLSVAAAAAWAALFPGLRRVDRFEDLVEEEQPAPVAG